MQITPDKIVRSKRKTLAITVDSSGRLIVRAPLRCSEARILAFIEKKSEWILRHKSKNTIPQSVFPTENLQGFQFSLEGRLCEIRYFSGKRFAFDEQNSVLYLPENKGADALRKWLKLRAKKVLSELVAIRAKQMGVGYKSVCISSAKGRWGSCSQDNTLRFTFRLLYAPGAIMDYVVVHELAHTIHKNHGKAFWEKVEKHCPDWKIKREWLKSHGYFMQIF